MDFTEAYLDCCSTVGMAARLGNIKAVKELIKNGKPTDVRDNRGWTPLHEAASTGHAECLQYLLTKGKVMPDWQTFESETALLLAARRGHANCVRLLLEHHADPNITTAEGFSPLYEGAKAGSLPVVKCLVEHPRFGSESLKPKDAAGRKVRAVNHAVFTGETALHAATEEGHDEVVSFLLRHGASVDIAADYNLTPVFYAAQYGRDRCLGLLLEAAKQRGQTGVVDIPAEDNATPLLIAAQNGKAECIKLLLDHGANANISVTSPPDLRPLQFAMQFDNLSSFKLLLPETSKDFALNLDHPLVIAAQKANCDYLTALIQTGYNIHSIFGLHDLYDYGDLPVFVPYSGSLLCVQPSLPAAKLLLKQGLPVNESNNSRLGLLSPLSSAILRGDVALCRLYLQNGAELNLSHQAFCGNLTLFYATVKKLPGYKLTPMFKFLLSKEDLQLRSCIDCVLSGRHRTHQQTLSDLLEVADFEPGSSMSILLNLCPALPVLDEDFLQGYSWWDHQRNYFQKVQATSNSLMHACRVRIVRRMLSNESYTEQGIASLQVPSVIHSYLKFTGSLGKHFIEAFDDT